MTIQRLMLDLDGLEVTKEEQEILAHPLVGGVILFSRNYENIEQLQQLVQSIRKNASSNVLISVDHEGGRVQRFRSEFTELPALALLGNVFNNDPKLALDYAKQHGWIMAAELKSMDIDFSFAPVLDLDYGVSSVIGDRAFHQDNQTVATLAAAYVAGMKKAGMASTGKHFPGHGAVTEDSHKEIPVDSRSRSELFNTDILPFQQLISQGLDAVMPAHVTYTAVDKHPAGFSKVWLQDILRTELGFEGVIFSDDLTMEGASVAGGFAERAEAALSAGCDMILACNNRAGAIDILDNVKLIPDDVVEKRIRKMKGDAFMERSALLADEYWQESVANVTALV